MSARLRQLIGSNHTPVVLECILLLAALPPLLAPWRSVARPSLCPRW